MNERLLIQDRREEDRELNYWMPYMDMSNKTRKILGFILLIINIATGLFIVKLDIFV